MLCYLMAFALLCVAAALVLWQRAGHAQGRRTAARFVDSRIGAVQGGVGAGAMPGSVDAGATMRSVGAGA
ncbi:MAG: hypothetical protein WDN30_16185 [Pararobbsia sp.]